MKLKYDFEKLQRVASDIYYSTGISVSIFETNFISHNAQKTATNGYCRKIREYPGVPTMCSRFDTSLLIKCKESRSVVSERCHGGFLNIAAPIMHDDEILGYVVLYSLRTNEQCEIPKTVCDYGCDEGELTELYRSLPLLNSRECEAVCNIATIVAKYVVLENLITLKSNDSLERVEKYINDNYASELSVDLICKKANVSKSVLYKRFNTEYGCTVGEYIHQCRISAAKRLLLQTDMSVDEIARSVGYKSADYFGRIFKKLVRCSPTQYRNSDS